MSATNRGAVRREKDAYETPLKLARFLVNQLDEDSMIPFGAKVLEPSCGRGAFLQALPPTVRQVHAVDVVDHGAQRLGPENTRFHHRDFAEMKLTDFGLNGFDLIVGNPPYNAAEEHVRHGISLLAPNGHLAFLLRMGFMESKARIGFWKLYPPSMVYVLSERPSFVSGGSDSAVYGMIVWKSRQISPIGHIRVVSWGGMDRPRSV